MDYLLCFLLSGDTLFALGCGRMFEGNAQQMWSSLAKMKPLPPATKVFCAHEYTQSNAKFALSVDPDNKALQQRAALINDLRKQVTCYSERFALCKCERKCPAVIVTKTGLSSLMMWQCSRSPGCKLNSKRPTGTAIKLQAATAHG